MIGDDEGERCNVSEDVEILLQENPGRYFSVLEIEVYTGLCRRVVRRELRRLRKRGVVEIHQPYGIHQYRWLESDLSRACFPKENALHP